MAMLLARAFLLTKISSYRVTVYRRGWMVITDRLHELQRPRTTRSVLDVLENLSLMSWAAQIKTCGSADWMNFQRGMERMASVRLGDRPNWMFCTSTFSSDCESKPKKRNKQKQQQQRENSACAGPSSEEAPHLASLFHFLSRDHVRRREC